MSGVTDAWHGTAQHSTRQLTSKSNSNSSSHPNLDTCRYLTFWCADPKSPCSFQFWLQSRQAIIRHLASPQAVKCLPARESTPCFLSSSFDSREALEAKPSRTYIHTYIRTCSKTYLVKIDFCFGDHLLLLARSYQFLFIFGASSIGRFLFVYHHAPCVKTEHCRCSSSLAPSTKHQAPRLLPKFWGCLRTTQNKDIARAANRGKGNRCARKRSEASRSGIERERKKRESSEVVQLLSPHSKVHSLQQPGPGSQPQPHPS